MRLVSDHDPHVLEHVLHAPGQVVGDDHDLHVDPEGGFGVVDELDLVLLDIRVPPPDLILPVDLQRRRTHNQQRPLMPIHIRQRQRLDSLTHAHLIRQQHPPMVPDTEPD